MRLFPRADSSPTPEPYVVPPSQEFDGNDGSWSTFKISVGTPAQEFRVLASTKSGETYLVLPEGCDARDPPDCPSLRGAGIFDSTQSPGFLLNASTSWSTIGQYAVNVENVLDYTTNGSYGYDKVSLGPASTSTSLSLDHQVVAGYANLDYWMGYLPLGVADSSFSSLSDSVDAFLYQMRNNTKIPSLSFAYTAGAKYRLKSVLAQLILGGYDSTRFKANENSDFSFGFSNDPSRLLTVGVDSITATNTLQGTYSLSSGAHFSLIDSTVPHLWLPHDICDAFEAAFGLSYDDSTELYLINSTMRDQLKARNPSITIKLVNSLENTSSNYTNIVLPYSAFDLQASYPYYDNATNYFPIRRAANETQYTLGRTLLQEAYLIVDYERGNFTVAQAVFPDPLPAAKIVTLEPPGSSSSSSKSGLSTGAIAGIAVGAAVLIILLLVGAFLLFRRRRRRRTNAQKYELANTQIAESGGNTANHSPAPHKLYHDPQELSGTALSELASPRTPGGDHKTFVSANDVPQELDAGMRHHPRWQEVTADNYHEMDAGSTTSRNVSQLGSQVPSEDGRYSGVSPLTGRFH